jgi:hypothetical protein
MDDRRALLNSISEAAFQEKVIATAQLHGWKCAHFRPMQDPSGRWRTAVAADGKGFPDLVLVHPRRGVIFAELKKETGTLAPEQKDWQAWLVAAGAVHGTWRPSDWPLIESILAGTSPKRRHP